MGAGIEGKIIRGNQALRSRDGVYQSQGRFSAQPQTHRPRYPEKQTCSRNRRERVGQILPAFDTVFAEGQRRYVESLSTYARQFIGRMDKPEVESIEGLSPAIAIEQRQPSQNPRSTVGTVTEIYDYLRLLYARVGIPHCYRCGREVKPQTVEMMTDYVLALPEGTKVSLLAPVVTGKRGSSRRS